MRKLIAILLCSLSLSAQIRIPNLPVTTTVSPNDFTMSQGASGLPGTTKIITWQNLINSLGIPTTSAWKNGLNAFGSTGTFGTSDANRIDFYSNNAIRGRLTSGGQWIIGSTFPGIIINSPLVAVGSGTTSASYAFGVYDASLTNNYFSLRNDSRMIYKDGNQSNGWVLKTDANGVATWTNTIPIPFTFGSSLDINGSLNANGFSNLNQGATFDYDGHCVIYNSGLFADNGLWIGYGPSYPNNHTNSTNLFFGNGSAILHSNVTAFSGITCDRDLSTYYSAHSYVDSAYVNSHFSPITGGAYVPIVGTSYNNPVTGSIQMGTNSKSIYQKAVTGKGIYIGVGDTSNLALSTNTANRLYSKDGLSKYNIIDYVNGSIGEANLQLTEDGISIYGHAAGASTIFTELDLNHTNSALYFSNGSSFAADNNKSNIGYKDVSGQTYLTFGSSGESRFKSTNTAYPGIVYDATSSGYVTTNQTQYSILDRANGDLRWSLKAGSTSITTVGTLTTGVWNASVIPGQYGGTGVANTGKTITLGGNLVTSGSFSTTLVQQFSGSTTLPSSSTTLIGNNLGISGGSTLIGGTASSENLTMSSTSSATKGNVIFGSTSKMFFDETNSRLKIGSSNSPNTALDVDGTICISTTGTVNARFTPSIGAGGYTGAGIVSASDLGFYAFTNKTIRFLGGSDGNSELARYDGSNGTYRLGSVASPTISTDVPTSDVVRNFAGNTYLSVSNNSSSSSQAASVYVINSSFKYGGMSVVGSNFVTSGLEVANQFRVVSGGSLSGGMLLYNDDGPFQIANNISVAPNLYISPYTVNSVAQSFPGRVGINTSSPSQRLHVAGKIVSDSAIGVATTAPTSTLQVNGSIGFPYVSKTGSYTVTASDYTVDNTSGANTITLPTAASVTGRIYVIKNSSSSTVTIATTSSQTIDGSTTVTLSSQYSGKMVQSDGSNWKIISSF